MRNNRYKIICILFSLVILVTSFAGCSGAKDEQSTKPTTTKITTTAKPITTAVTTENLDTTFAETSTRKVYKGLDKDTSSDYKYKIATYTTSYTSSNTTRTANLSTAAKKINNVVVPNGQVFSFNQTVGKRTVTAGYETAKIIADGEFVDGLGGGVCQVSSTVFETVLRANVKIVSRANHTLEISYVPLGGDATVQWNTTDFQFKNTLGTDIKLTMTCGGGKLVCSVYAKKDIDVGDIKINITKSGDKYVLTRTVNGKRNYRTTSKYKKASS